MYLLGASTYPYNSISTAVLSSATCYVLHASAQWFIINGNTNWCRLHRTRHILRCVFETQFLLLLHKCKGLGRSSLKHLHRDRLHASSNAATTHANRRTGAVRKDAEAFRLSCPRGRGAAIEGCVLEGCARAIQSNQAAVLEAHRGEEHNAVGPMAHHGAPCTCIGNCSAFSGQIPWN